jgi:hypothetical protein
MKTINKFLLVFVIIASLTGCDDKDENIFELSPEERAAAARTALMENLVEAENGWKVKYQPETESGAFWVLMNFNEDGTVRIQSDLSAEDEKYFDQTLTYRIDNSLGTELIFETYSFFSYLFEQDQATFLAEYEFFYVNETPDGSLVFRSKTDPGDATILLFEPATGGDENLLGQQVSQSINTISDDISGLLFTSPGYMMTYEDRDLVLYLTLNDSRRTLNISAATKKSGGTTQSINFSTGYFLQGDSIIFQTPLEGTFQNVNVVLNSVLVSKLTDDVSDICGGRPIHKLEGTTSGGDDVLLEATLNSPQGAQFTSYGFLVSPIEYIFNNGESSAQAIANDIAGAGSLQLYWNLDGFYAMGFYVLNTDGTNSWLLREFTPQRTGNHIVFNFVGDVEVYGNPTSANVNNVVPYLNALTQGGETYAFEVGDGIYEFNNPCTGWTAAFIGIQ